MSLPRLGILVWGIFATLAPPAGGQTVLFRDFTNTSGLTRNSASVSGGVIVLADNSNDRGAVFTSATHSVSSFSAAFEFRITNPGGGTDSFSEQGADGLAFVLQRAQASALGSAGEGLGYLGINQSVAVEFDTWFNANRADPDSNHYGLDLNGSVNSVATASEATRFDNGQKWSVWVDYNGTTLEVRTSTTGVRPTTTAFTYGTAQMPFDVAGTIGSASAYIGFTGATGSATGTHQLLSFAFSDTYLAGGVSVVPEPSTCALFGLGLGGIAFAWWRRRRV